MQYWVQPWSDELTIITIKLKFFKTSQWRLPPLIHPDGDPKLLLQSRQCFICNNYMWAKYSCCLYRIMLELTELLRKNRECC